MDEQEREKAISRAIEPIRKRQVIREQQEKLEKVDPARRRAIESIRESEAFAVRFLHERIKSILEQIQRVLTGGPIAFVDAPGRGGVLRRLGWTLRMDPNVEMRISIAYRIEGAAFQIVCAVEEDPELKRQYLLAAYEFEEATSLLWLDEQIPEAAKYIATHRRQARWVGAPQFRTATRKRSPSRPRRCRDDYGDAIGKVVIGEFVFLAAI